jgi:hypothetical protein
MLNSILEEIFEGDNVYKNVRINSVLYERAWLSDLDSATRCVKFDPAVNMARLLTLAHFNWSSKGATF